LASFNSVHEELCGGDYRSDSGDEEEWNFIQSGAKVQVDKIKCFSMKTRTKHSNFSQIYFTRNGKIIGKKEIRIPNGGFYPTVGMMISDEKVRVDLRPLSG